VKVACRLPLILTISSAAFGCQVDAKALVIQSVKNYERAWRQGMNWSYTQTDVTVTDGEKEVDVSQVAPLDGTPYERLISKNGHALTPEEQKKEDEKYDRELKKRENETPEERRARIAKYEKERAFLKDVPSAYDYQCIGDEPVNGRGAWVIKLTPRPDFVPTTSHGALLKHIEGKLWIDKQDMQWAKAEADVVSTVSIGFILARIGPGAHINMDFTRISDDLWVPRDIVVKGAARVLLVHTKNLDENLTFSNYRLQTPPKQVASSSKAAGKTR